MLTIEFVEHITSGKLPQGYHFTDGQFHLLYVDDGELYDINTFVEYGLWEGLEFSDPEQMVPDDDVTEFSIHYLPGAHRWFVWKLRNIPADEDLHRYAVVPDEEPAITETVYKLYYAYDVDKLYMNTYEFWNFIATLRHGLMKELAEDHHLHYHTNERHWEQHQNQSGTSLPDAGADYRGLFFLVLNENSPDELYVCMQVSEDTYEWKQVSVS